MVWLIIEPFVDGNYWSDYQSKYPYAKEIGKLGLPNLIWDTLYSYGGSLGNFTDNHPLIDPVVVPASPKSSCSPFPSPISNSTPANSPTQNSTLTPYVPEFSVWAVLLLVLVATLLIVAFVNKSSR